MAAIATTPGEDAVAMVVMAATDTTAAKDKQQQQQWRWQKRRKTMGLIDQTKSNSLCFSSI